MSLTEAVTNAPTTRHRGNRTPCSVGVLIDSLTGPELDALLFMLYGDERTRGGWGWSQARVWRTLTAEGYTVSQQQINRHRSGQCRCEGDA